MSFEDTECLGYLIKVANKNAKRCEEVHKLKRDKEWRKAASGGNGGCAKAAYAYAKGPNGSQQSPLHQEDDDDSFDETLGASDLAETDSIRLSEDRTIFSGMNDKQTVHDRGQGCEPMPSSLQQAVEKEASKWASLWKVGQ